MPSWPSGIPHTPLAESYSFEPVPQAISTQMDSGPPKRRRRFSVAYGTHSMSFILTGSQRATFQTFYLTTIAGGSLAFTGLADPTDGTAATFQFANGGDPRWAALRPDASIAARRWLLTITLERTA